MADLALASCCEYAVAGRALAGQRRSGDAALVLAIEGGVLIAVVDGLGHGEEAALAADTALRVVRAHAGEPLPVVVDQCHRRLLTTRGVALVLAAIDAARATLSWLGVGNVEAVLLGARPGEAGGRYWLTNRGGVVGHRLPPVAVTQVTIRPGDLLLIATDGIDEGFVSARLPAGSTAKLARHILDGHGRVNDDALVLALRWLGGQSSERSQP